MVKAELDDLNPIKVTVWLKWFNSRTIFHQESIETSVDVRRPGVLTISRLSNIPQAKEISIEVYFDDKLMCYVVQPLESSELWR